MSSTRRYSGFANRRVVGRYGDGVSGRHGLGGVQRIDQDEVGAEHVGELQAASAVRSLRSPIPHELLDRSWNRAASAPTPAPAAARGRSSRCGVTTRTPADVPTGAACPDACASPGGRSLASPTVARPTSRPSTSLRLDPCVDRARSPIGRRPQVRPTPSPGRRAARGPEPIALVPGRITTVGGRIRRQGFETSVSRALRRRASDVLASTPRASSTARTVGRAHLDRAHPPVPVLEGHPVSVREGAQQRRPGVPTQGSRVTIAQQSGCRCTHGARPARVEQPATSNVASPARSTDELHPDRQPGVGPAPAARTIAGCPVTLYGEVNGVKRFCASKSAAGSVSSRRPPDEGGQPGERRREDRRRSPPSLDVPTDSAHAGTRASPHQVRAPTSGSPRARSHRVSGSSRLSSSGGDRGERGQRGPHVLEVTDDLRARTVGDVLDVVAQPRRRRSRRSLPDLRGTRGRRRRRR